MLFPGRNYTTFLSRFSHFTQAIVLFTQCEWQQFCDRERMRHITPLGHLYHIRRQVYVAKVLVLYVYTLLKQLHEDSFPSKESGKLSTQVLSSLLYNVSYYMYIFIYPTFLSLVVFK